LKQNKKHIALTKVKDKGQSSSVRPKANDLEFDMLSALDGHMRLMMTAVTITTTMTTLSIIEMQT